MIHTQINKGILRNFLFCGYYSNFWTFCAQASRFQVAWSKVDHKTNARVKKALGNVCLKYTFTAWLWRVLQSLLMYTYKVNKFENLDE